MNFLQMGLEGLEQGIIIISKDHSIQYINQAFERLLKTNREDVIGKTMLEAFPKAPEDIRIITRSLVLKKEHSLHFHPILLRDLNIHVSVETKLLENQGEFQGVMAIFTDKTLQVELAQEHQKKTDSWKMHFETILHHAGDAMFLVDFDKSMPKFIEVNQKMLEVLGYSRDEFLALNVFDLLHPDSYDITIEVYHSLKEKGTATIQCQYLTKEKSAVHVHVTFTKYMTDEIRLLVIVRDISLQQAIHTGLKEALTFDETLLDSLQMCMTVIEDDYVKLSNQKSYELFEVSRQENSFIGQSSLVWLERISRRMVDGEGAIRQAVSIMEGHELVKDWEIELFNNKYLSVDYIPLHLNSSKRIHIWVGTDITERKRDEQKLRDAHHIETKLINSLQEGILLIKNDTIELVSESLSAYYPFEKEISFKQRHIKEFYKHLLQIVKYPHSEMKKIQTIVQQNELVTGQELELVNGAFIEYDFIPFVLQDETQARLWVFRDITKSKKTMESLEEATRSAEKANQSKNLLLSQISHDLRTPLNSILGYSQLLTLDQSINENVRLQLERIHYSAQLLNGLIQDILDFTMLETGHVKTELQSLSVGKSINDVTHIAQGLAASKKINFKVEKLNLDGFVEADPIRLTQILLNLISNAIKYNSPGGSVILKVTKENDTITYTIIDDGIGIEQEHLEYIKQPFYRVKGQSTEDGSGLGLAIVEKLTRNMNGSFGIESKLGKGTTVWVRFPVKECDGQCDNRPFSLNQEESSLKVLYIEDTQMNIEVMRGMLESITNVQLLTAKEGKHGLKLAEETQVNFILLDLGLPDIDGMEVLRELKGKPQTKDIPIIIVTANSLEEIKEEAMRSGASDYITKPIELAKIREVVNQFK
ncbi:PAS domain-containing sensor histidine kinase [Bacillus sp. ISL-55]|uniref:PAS domain-containing hybrid sensor histidine kinase/response regulator n=1 Tax=Bacillus sp. ISL-55 TaxID=2819134 RepID=UPI001BE575BE|nr:PAS domain-containing sensor histidine kinase [Bacillus sp. ISL-55]MBT2693634.1 response regulator [Bacillus sp. ISL-55]